MLCKSLDKYNLILFTALNISPSNLECLGYMTIRTCITNISDIINLSALVIQFMD